MQYVLQPTQDDVLHSAKGTTWKNHKYVDIVTKNGKRVYKYGRYLTSKAKSKITGNTVTNKNGTAYSPTIKTIRGPVAISNKAGTPYNPTIKTIDPHKDIGGKTASIKNDHYETLNKALAENMTAETKADGLTLFNNIMQAHRKTSVTNNTLNAKQYTPTYKTSPKPYSPTVKTFYNGTLPTEYTGTNVGKGNVISGKNHYQVLNRRKKKK